MLRLYAFMLAMIAVLEILCPPVIAQQAPSPQQAPGAAQAPDPEQILLEAEKYFEALEYEEALKAFSIILQIPNAAPIQRARALLYMGVCFTAVGNAENAVLAFMELLKIKPDFRLPEGVSPSVVEMFKEALKRLNLPETPAPGADPASGEAGAEEPPVTIEAKTKKKVPAGTSIEVQINLLDPDKLVEDVVLHWRRIGGPDYSTIRVKHAFGAKKMAAQIPGAVIGPQAGRLHYYIEAIGEGGKTLGHAGTMNAPHEVVLQEAPSAKSTWGWYALGIGGGLAVVGGIVAAILLTRGNDNGSSQDLAEMLITIK